MIESFEPTDEEVEEFGDEILDAMYAQYCNYATLNPVY